MDKKKTIALVAHDNKKAEIVGWAMKNKDSLAKFNLCGTGTTAKLVAKSTGLEVKVTFRDRWAATSKSVQK